MDQLQTETHDVGPGLLESAWRRRWLVLLIALIGGAAGFGWAAMQVPSYSATAQLLLSDPQEIGRLAGVERTVETVRHVRNQEALIRSGVLTPTVADLLDDGSTADHIASRVSVEVRDGGDVNVIDVTATGDTAGDAAELANAVTRAYRQVVSQRVDGQTQAAIDELRLRNEALRSQIDDLAAAGATASDPEDPDPAGQAALSAAVQQLVENEGRIEQLTVDAALYGSGVDAVAQATAPAGPDSPRPVRSVAFGVLVGLVLGSGLAWWRNSVTRKADDSRDPAALLEAPLLGEIPEFGKVGASGPLASVTAPLSPAAEAYQFITSSLTFALVDNDHPTVLITSATPREGKTVTALNIGIAAHRNEQRVLLIDADQRMRGLSRLCGVGQTGQRVTLGTGVTTTQVDLTADTRLELLGVEGDVEDRAAYFRTAAFRQTIARSRSAHDLIVVDSPPILAVAETSAIASHVDGIVLVVSRGTSMRALAEVRRRLDFIGTPLLGYVFNRALPRTSVFSYVKDGYNYGTTNGGATSRRADANAKASSQSRRGRAGPARSVPASRDTPF